MRRCEQGIVGFLQVRARLISVSIERNLRGLGEIRDQVETVDKLDLEEIEEVVYRILAYRNEFSGLAKELPAYYECLPNPLAAWKKLLAQHLAKWEKAFVACFEGVTAATANEHRKNKFLVLLNLCHMLQGFDAYLVVDDAVAAETPSFSQLWTIYDGILQAELFPMLKSILQTLYAGDYAKMASDAVKEIDSKTSLWKILSSQVQARIQEIVRRLPPLIDDLQNSKAVHPRGLQDLILKVQRLRDACR